jgi:RNA polymerase sigma factor (sigma-70 family)
MANDSEFRQLIDALAEHLPKGRPCSRKDLETIFRATYSALVKYAETLLRTSPAMNGHIGPEDLVQSVWLPIVNRAQRAGGSICDIGPWLRIQLRQEFVDAYRRAHSQKRSVTREVSLHGQGEGSAGVIDVVAPNTDPPEAAVRGDRLGRFFQCIEDLKRSDKETECLSGEIVYLRHRPRMPLTNEQVAKRFKITASKASTLYWQGLTYITQRMREQSGLSESSDK